MENKKVAVLCSGGVDSSVALHILHMQKKYNIVVFYLKIWLQDELHYLGNCPWEEDVSFVKETCRMIDVPFEQIPLQKEYWDLVVLESISMIKKGLTPNPDIFCNSMIKFGVFHDLYGKYFDYLATGHYAHIEEKDDWSYLTHTSDSIKDQTYFLSYTPYEKIKKSLFPLGILENKSVVRQYAQKYNLPAANRKDSQGICFLGKIPFKDFIEYHCGIKKGALIEYETNKKIGEHNGFWFYTIGQRQGIGLSGGPWYVIAKNHLENIVYISRQSQKNKNYQIIIKVSQINYLVPSTQKLCIDKNYKIKLRHGQEFNRCCIMSTNESKSEVKVKIQNPDQGVASGQCMVFYNEKNQSIGCGIMYVE